MFEDDEIIDFNEETFDSDEPVEKDAKKNKNNKKKTENTNSNAKESKKKKKGKGWKGHVIRSVVALVILVALYFTAVYSNIPFIEKWRTLYIETAMSTMTHKWLATAFFPQSVIDEVQNAKKENREEQKLLETSWNDSTEEEEAVENLTPEELFYKTYWELDTKSVRNYLTSNPSVAGDYTEISIEDPDGALKLETVNGDSLYALNQKYNTMIIALHDSSYEAKLAIVKDPSQVQLKKASNLGTKGDTIAEYGKKYDALVAINASGFEDQGGHGKGGAVAGCLIIDGVDYGRGSHTSRKFYGMKTADNRLYIDNLSAIDKTEYKWGVQFQPALVVDSKCVVDGSYGMGIQPRTSVGQAKDGSFMMLVVDGRQVGYSVGCTVKTCAEILMSYGAKEAANFDGGSSSIMWYNGKQITKPSSVSKVGRYLPDALLIMKTGE